MPRKSTKLFHKYYKEWIELYKKDAVRHATLVKYELAHKHVKEIYPNLHLHQLDRKSYQLLLNKFAENHAHETTLDFHHHLKACLVDAYEDGIIRVNPTRKAIIKGTQKRKKKKKFLNRDELQALLSELNLPAEVNWDWFIYLISKTGLRFAEALALTPADFDYENQQININKSWNYKFKDYGFQPTKNKSSNRKIFVDNSTLKALKKLIKEKDPDQPIFVNQDQKIFNSTVNSRLATLCRHANIPTISIHGLLHTHASLLLFQGVSVLSVSRRLGHANITTTQETYLHIIKELETKDNRKILKHLKEL
ncbi:site-specific integrase [Ligilactobacillus salivarius]|uniref:Integrase n=1 Tax=Ligilactobacillus salivarius TaxID=1624 RepID=A0A1D7TU20_9LACO|nr:site-specific integrase [Ligilactobacillus salivarius]AOO74439.1 integrase [Ligilactobacillus salivarius]UDE98257.1 site-specific integrase [Ligilactobacillus salivarius]UUV97386.1 site-specific integrase [Ligilactobacillus salivarius]